MAKAILAISGIYAIRNIANGRIYVGSAVNISRRWADHKKGLRANLHHSRKLQNSWNKYGEECFEFSIIEIVDNQKELIAREQHWIDLNKASGKDGLNMSPTAFSLLGFKHSEETKEKCRTANVGRKMPTHVMDALRRANVGRKFSDDHRKNLSLAGMGRIASPESIAKTVSAHLGAKRSIETRNRISQARKGKQSFLGLRHSEESKLKISEAKIGVKLSAEHKEKLSAASKGKPKSDATKERMKEAAKRRWASKKTELGVVFSDLRAHA